MRNCKEEDQVLQLICTLDRERQTDKEGRGEKERKAERERVHTTQYTEVSGCTKRSSRQTDLHSRLASVNHGRLEVTGTGKFPRLVNEDANGLSTPLSFLPSSLPP